MVEGAQAKSNVKVTGSAEPGSATMRRIVSRQERSEEWTVEGQVVGVGSLYMWLWGPAGATNGAGPQTRHFCWDVHSQNQWASPQLSQVEGGP